MQKTMKQKGAAPAPKTRWHGDPGSLGISHREYFALTKLFSQAEALGVKATGLAKGPFGAGCVLQLSSSDRNYEVVIDGTGNVILGRIEASGRRVRLWKGGTNTEAQWSMLLQAWRNSEGRLS